MKLRTLGLLFFSPLIFACATTSQPGQAPADPHAHLAPEPVAPAPEKVSVPDYLDFLDSLAASVAEQEPRPLNSRELQSYRQIDGQLREALAGVETIEEMSRDRQVRVFNLHEELQSVIIGAPENQVICRREATVGTHFRRVSCITVAEFQQRQKDSSEFLRDMFRSGPMIDPNPGAQ